MKLVLNKTSKSTYTNRAGNVLITVAKCYISNQWSGRVEIYNGTAKDFLGNTVKMYDSVFEYNATTKKEVSKAIVNFIQND